MRATVGSVSLESNKQPVRTLTTSDLGTPRPVYAVWEVTLACDQPCQHCGSRAGKKRDNELDTEELLEVARSLARLGCREVALIGGEAYMRKDLPALITELHQHGVRVVMQTGGRKFTRERAQHFRQAGLTGLGVSIDGLQPEHDLLRGNIGSFEAALRALDNATDAGLVTSANTQINRLNYHQLRDIYGILRDKDIQTWQVQLTVPMGEAADRPEWLIEPWRIIEIIDTLADLQLDAVKNSRQGEPFNIFANNNIGYFGPHEQLLRSRPGGASVHWQGCLAGISLLGIESDGTIKGCPSLPTDPYAGGNVRELSLEDIWQHSKQVRFSRDRQSDELWGFCKTCYYADTCRAGCSWTAHCTLGRRGNNPFCYHRATELKKQNRRERLVAKRKATGQPYDYGCLEIIEEEWPIDDETDTRKTRRRLHLTRG